MKLSSLQELLMTELQDLYDAEHQILQALPQMAQAASSPDLKQAFQQHQQQTQGHVRRLEQAFQLLGTKAERKSCKAMEGLISEGQELLSKNAPSDVLDAALIGAAQKVEHYEIASYGTARTHARTIGNSQLAQLLQETLDEESTTNEKLTAMAESHINIEATKGNGRR